jgi:hypothetical protein
MNDYKNGTHAKDDKNVPMKDTDMKSGDAKSTEKTPAVTTK